MKLSILVNGFPDDCEDKVLAAVSSLKLDGYIVLSDYQPSGQVSIVREKRQEILQIVDNNFYPHNAGVSKVPVANENKSPTQIKYQPQIRAAAIASLVVLGLFAVVVPALPATSTDTEIVSHYHNFQPHWYAYETGNDDADMSGSHMHVSQMSAVLQDCSQKQQS